MGKIAPDFIGHEVMGTSHGPQTRMGKIACALIRHESVREELRTARRGLLRALRSLRMELLAKRPHLNGAKDLKLHIGCGPLIHKGWINLYLYPCPGAFYLDAMNGLPFASETVRHIHCEHFLEHLGPEHAARFLTECWRILTPGGTVRVIVPDAEKYLRAYARDDREFFGALKRLGNSEIELDTPMKVVNQTFRMGDDHKFAWDFDTLALTAKRIGFTEAMLSSFG